MLKVDVFVQVLLNNTYCMVLY